MCKTLMIDDNPIEHLIMQKMFDKYEVFEDTAHTLDAASIINFLEENHCDLSLLPDVIFLDLNMPYSGWQFLTDLESLMPALHKQPDVFIVSSSIDCRDKLRATEFASVKGFISKPLPKQMLAEIVERYLPSKHLAN
ncbi:response regulator [Mucilaginibacter sp. UR6-1]|uniref:response regulator n=1 Tax=Mucilaginibacter sp. UR6-1 TaxID=1435643 RepID=UPI001E564566|nr:response regulator [Mucilaginibacter sp. UR6-1]MCC8409295.1 response regulator [Mucilaginibacter sp. UR6-1]